MNVIVHTDTHTRPSAPPGPLRWLLVQFEVMLHDQHHCNTLTLTLSEVGTSTRHKIDHFGDDLPLILASTEKHHSNTNTFRVEDTCGYRRVTANRFKAFSK